MKKWVILQREKNEPKTIWEYFETKEDARKDSHVMETIERYSESYPINEILPMAVNDVGGCTYMPRDSEEIVEIVLSETKPELNIYEQYPVNCKDIFSGWMSPDGTTFSCGEYGHIDCAERLCKELHIPIERITVSDDKLIENGWIKIVRRQWWGRWDKITDKQIDVLESLNIKHIHNISYKEAKETIIELHKKIFKR